MKDIDKLRALIPHWIEHNHEHAAEYLKWAEKGGEVADDIREAANALNKVNWSLKHALDELGGPAEYKGPPHHHHHQH